MARRYGTGLRLGRAGGEGDGGVENVEGRALPAGVGPVERPRPAHAELVRGVLAVAPHRGRVGQHERAVVQLAVLQIEVVQVTGEDPLELDLVAVASSLGRLARLGE